MSGLHLTLDELRARAPLFRRTSVAVGNFDGVHIGHAHILQLAIRHGAAAGETPIALTFDPHPRAVVGPGAPPALATQADRNRLMRELGIETVVSLHFDKQVAGLAAERFVHDVLVVGLGASRVVVGDNFRFGRGAQGSPEMLRDMGARHGFIVHAAATVRGPDDDIVSSSVIRRMLAEGDVTTAARLLNRGYDVVGRATDLDGPGRDPYEVTVAVEPMDGLLVPGDGVYRVAVTFGNEDQSRPGVAEVRHRPDAGGSPRRLFVRGLGFPVVTVDEYVRVTFLERKTAGEVT